MAAYAALVTLSKAIHQILPYEQHYSFLCAKHQMKSLLDKVNSFQVFLEDVSGKSSDRIDDLENQIRDVAYRLEDIVESILVDSLAMEYQGEVNLRLSIQEANSEVISPIGEAGTQIILAAGGRAKSRKSFFRGFVNKLCVPCCRRNTNKDGSGSAEASTSVREHSVEMKKTLYGKRSLSILSPGATDTKVALEDDVNQTGGHEFTVPSTPAESETILEGKVVTGSFSILSPGATDTEVVLEDGVNQTTGHESNVPSTSAESETIVSLDDILGWCLDQDLENKAEYSHLPLTVRVAATFWNSIEEAALLLEEALDMKKILDNKLVISGTSVFSPNIATPILSGGPPDTNNSTVGLNDDLHQILDRITSEQRAREVIPITGMGGIGKTTLARAVYDHHGKQDHFDLVLWATVSQQYNVKEILRSLLSVDATNIEPNKTLIELVHQRLYSRRYLIILDDVWDEKVWDGIRNAFPNNNNCSRIILTTRLANVATYVSCSSTCAHQMQLLSEEQSWDLLQETVYRQEIGCPSKFEYYTGRRILRNCKGLPLALIVIGGLLKLNNAEDHWEHVATSTTSEAAADDDSLLRIFSLSYRNLPPHLKACFLYFGMFPEDKEIRTKELVRLWCAEGFLKPRGSRTMEEVAEECLHELVERNLVLVMKKRYDGKIKTSSIHDVLRELSLSQAKTEKFLYHGSSWIDNDTFLRIIKDHQRRVSFPKINLDRSISLNSPIRTFRFDQLSDIIPQFKLVRVLGTVKFSSSALRNSVRLSNLRYLHLHGYSTEPLMVPKSISTLRNLETLVVSNSHYYSDGKYDMILPVEIWEMPRLRHLVSEVKMELPPFPASGLYDDSSIDSSSLQTLTGLVNCDFTPSVIQKLKQNLKKLQIKYQKISRGDEEKELFRLDNLHHLEDLTVSCELFAPSVMNIGLPCKLKKLRLEYTELPWEKMTLIRDLIHLQVLKLSHDAFSGKVWEPIEGGFPQLKYLKMDHLYELEEWRAESAHFPSLEKLVILECPYLKEVPAEIGEIDTLEKLIVRKRYDDSVGDGFEESVRRIKEEQDSLCNDSLQVIILSKDQRLFQVDK